MMEVIRKILEYEGNNSKCTHTMEALCRNGKYFRFFHFDRGWGGGLSAGVFTCCKGDIKFCVLPF